MKLDNFGPVYYINLDGDFDRQNSIIDQFKKYNVTDYYRIGAYDGRNDDLSDYICGSYPGYNISSKEIGCTISHLKALKEWISNKDSEYAIICEDDLDISICDYWNFVWDEFISNLPEDWDCVQTSAINGWNYQTTVKLHDRHHEEWSTASYLIKREYAEYIVKKYCKNDRYNLSLYNNKAVADNLIYTSGRTYTVNIFSYNTDFTSNIHEDHLDNVHRPTRKYVLEWWKQNGKNVSIQEILKK